MRLRTKIRNIKRVPWWFLVLLLIIPVLLLITKSGIHVSAFNLSADFAIGQPDTSSSSTNAGGSISSAGYNYPDGLATDGTHVFVSDCSNNRVLVYNHFPTSSGQQADFVIGQQDMSSGTVNQGLAGFPTDSTTQLKSSIATYWDFNNSGTKFTNLSLNNTAADGTYTGTSVASGKVGGARSYNGVSDKGVSTFWDVPSGAAARSVFVWVKPSSNGETGAIVSEGIAVAGREATLGLSGGNVSFTSFGTTVTGSTSLTAGNWYFVGYTYDGSGNIRIYVNGSVDAGPTAVSLNTQSTSTGFGFDIAQTNNFFAGTIDDVGVWLDALSSTAISELYNSGSGEAFATHISGRTLNCPTYLATDGSRLFVTDSGNNRVLVFNPQPAENNPTADLVIGQQNMSENFQNREGSPGANTLNNAIGVSYDSSSGKLLIGDSGNNRVLIYNSVPTQNNTSADVVVGQADMSGGTANMGNPTSSADSLNYPSSASIANNKLLVSDSSNNRVLVFNTVPGANGASADVVIGQPTFADSSDNQGGTTTAQTLSFPMDTLWDGNKLMIADDGNNRISIYNSIPSSNNASAIDALGQGNLTDNTFGSSSTQLSDPEGQIVQAGTTLLVGDSSNNRVLGYSNFLQTPITSTPNPAEIANKAFLHTDVAGTKAVLAMLEDGSTLYVGGIFSTICNTDGSNCVARDGLAAIDETTGQVTSWDPQLTYTTSVEVDSIIKINNIIYVSGFFNHAQGNVRGNIAAFDATTGNLLSFAPIANSGITTLDADTNYLYAGGYFTSIDGSTRHGLASFDISTDSGHLTSWAPPSDDAGVLKLKLYNKVLYVGGYFNSIGCLDSGSCPTSGESRKLLAAFYATTSADFLTGLDFNLNTDSGFSAFSSVQSMAFCSSTFYFGGNFTGVNGQSRDDLAAVNLTDNSLLSFAPNPGPRGPTDYASGIQDNNREVFSLSIYDNTLYVGGDFSDISGIHRQGVASYDLTNTTESFNTWNPKVGHYGIVDVIYPTKDHIYVGGDFSVEGLTGAIGATTSAKNLAQFNYTSGLTADVCGISTSATPTVTSSPTPSPTESPAATATLTPTPTGSNQQVATPSPTLTTTFVNNGLPPTGPNKIVGVGFVGLIIIFLGGLLFLL